MHLHHAISLIYHGRIDPHLSQRIIKIDDPRSVCDAVPLAVSRQSACADPSVPKMMIHLTPEVYP